MNDTTSEYSDYRPCIYCVRISYENTGRAQLWSCICTNFERLKLFHPTRHIYLKAMLVEDEIDAEH
jgi:hypothetical protein